MNRVCKIEFTLLILLIVCASCTKKQNTTAAVVMYHDPIVITPSPKEPQELLEVQPMLAFGKIENPVFTDSMKVEQNMMSQIVACTSAMLHGDGYTCTSYLYPDAVRYCKKYYPGLSDEKVLEELFKELAEDIQPIYQRYAEKGIEMAIVVPNLVRKVVVGDNDIIIVFNTTSNICSDNVYTHFKDMSHDIGISQNGGVNWWFMTENEDTPTILKMHYSQEVVNKIMGYSL